jgi:O-antigen/teichoic acid export membrane protein
MGVIKRQGIKNTIATYIGFAVGFVNLIVIQPNFLTKEELGLTRVLYSFALLVAMFVPLGIGNATTRFFPRFKNLENRHHGFFGFMLVFPLIGFALAAIVLFLAKDFIMGRYATESPLFNEFFYYVFPLTFFVSIISVLSIYCSSNFKSTIPTYLNDIVVRFMAIAVVSMYYLKWLTLDQFIMAFVAIYAIQMLGLFFYIFVFDRPGFKIDWPFFREQNFIQLIRYGLLLWFASVASIGLKFFDAIMIGQYMPLSFVGIYTVAAFIPTIIEAPLNAFDRIASSKIAFAWKENNREEINSIYQKSSLYMFMIGGFLFLNVNINIYDLFTFLPEGYDQGAPIVIILSLASLYNMATGLNAAILFNSDKYRLGAFFLISLAVIVLILQVVFIPWLGMKGAAIATAMASFIYNSLLFWYVRKHFALQPFEKENKVLLLLIIVLFGIGFLLPSTGVPFLNILYKGTVISTVYIGYVYFKNLTPEAFDWIKKKG